MHRALDVATPVTWSGEADDASVVIDVVVDGEPEPLPAESAVLLVRSGRAKYADRAARIKAVRWRLEAREQARRALAVAVPVPVERLRPHFRNRRLFRTRGARKHLRIDHRTRTAAPRPREHRPRERRASRSHSRRGPPRDDDPPDPLASAGWRGFAVASLRLHAHELRRSGARRAAA